MRLIDLIYAMLHQHLKFVLYRICKLRHMDFVKSLTQQSTLKFTTFLFNIITHMCRLHRTLAAVTVIQYMTWEERSTALNNPKQLKSGR
jgi:hypothetical protein